MTIAGPADNRLATYGTLAPGKPNHGQLSKLPGDWLTGAVRGVLKEAGWGAAMGFPGLVLDDDGDEISVHIFQSAELPGHWSRLDAFEGPGYQRRTTRAQTPLGPCDVSIYELADPLTGLRPVPHTKIEIGDVRTPCQILPAM